MLIENPLNSSPLTFPVLECVHIVGFALSVGTIAVVDFRLGDAVALIDADPSDPWPRHQQHSGASIAVTATALRRARKILVSHKTQVVLEPDLPMLDLDDVLQHAEGGALLLDTRDPADYASGHLRGAVNNGLSRGEIKEMMLQSCIYAGFPAGLEAFRVATELFKELDAE